MSARDIQKSLYSKGLQFANHRAKFVIPKLRSLSKSFNDVQKNVHISKVAGSSGAIVGGGLAIAGFVASFFTFGASLVVSAIGMGLGAAGGATIAGASIGDTVQTKLYEKEADRILEEDRKLLQEMLESNDSLPEALQMEGLQKPKSDVKRSNSCVKVYQAATKALTTGGAAGKVLVYDIPKTVVKLAGTVGDDVAKTVFKVASPAARGFHVVGGVLSIIALPFDIHTLVTSSITLAKNEHSSLSKVIEDLANELEENLQNLNNALAEFEDRFILSSYHNNV